MEQEQTRPRLILKPKQTGTQPIVTDSPVIRPPMSWANAPQKSYYSEQNGSAEVAKLIKPRFLTFSDLVRRGYVKWTMIHTGGLNGQQIVIDINVNDQATISGCGDTIEDAFANLNREIYGTFEE